MRERFEQLYPQGQEHIYDDERLSALEEKTAISGPRGVERLVSESDALEIRDYQRVGEDEVHIVSLESGRYLISQGFPEASATDTKHVYRNNAHEVRHTPLQLERNAPEFIDLKQQFERRTRKAQTAGEVLYELMSVIDERIESYDGREHIRSSTDIIRAGKSACTGKSLIAAMLLRESFPEFDVQYVDGSTEQTKHMNIQAHADGHAWLRIALPSERATYLYDPSFHRLEAYGMDSPKDLKEADDPFRSYDVYMNSAVNLVTQGMQYGTNVYGHKLIDVPVEDEHKTMLMPSVPSQHALHAMVKGRTLLVLDASRKTHLGLINGSLVVSADVQQVHTAARMEYPLRNIIRL